MSVVFGCQPKQAPSFQVVRSLHSLNIQLSDRWRKIVSMKEQKYLWRNKRWRNKSIYSMIHNLGNNPVPPVGEMSFCCRGLKWHCDIVRCWVLTSTKSFVTPRSSFIFSISGLVCLFYSKYHSDYLYIGETSSLGL